MRKIHTEFICMVFTIINYFLIILRSRILSIILTLNLKKKCFSGIVFIFKNMEA